MSVLHVFADTNLFLQCKNLEELDWSMLGAHDHVEILVTRPVITEIDSLKGGGNGRRAARSRLASKRFRSLMTMPALSARIRETPGIVDLCLRQNLKPIQPEPEELDYQSGDGRLVGTMLAFCRADPDALAVLLTHDNGPAMSAEAVGLRSVFVPDAWLLPPESTDNALKAKLEQYERQEPRFEISLSPEGRKGIQATLPHYQELTQEELLVLMSYLKARFPRANDFGSTEPAEHPVKFESARLSFTQARDVYEPASREDIDGYNKAYAKWEEDSRKHLQDVHRLLHIAQAWPRLEMSIANIGSRPANDALVVLDVQGSEDVSLLPPRARKGGDDDGDDDDDAGPLKGVNLAKLLRLQAPPPPPRGTWRRIDAYTMVSRSLADLPGFGKSIEPAILSRSHFVAPQIDPNKIYFKEGGRGEPDRHIEYSCQQWRHAQPAHELELLVISRQPSAATCSGVIRVEVHASNLTRPAVATLPFKLTFERTSSFEEAKKLVEAIGT